MALNGSCWYCEAKNRGFLFFISSRNSEENLSAQKDSQFSLRAGIFSSVHLSRSRSKISPARSSSLHLCIMSICFALSFCLRVKNVDQYQSETVLRTVSLSASCRVAYGSSIIRQLCTNIHSAKKLLLSSTSISYTSNSHSMRTIEEMASSSNCGVSYDTSGKRVQDCSLYCFSDSYPCDAQQVSHFNGTQHQSL